MKSRITVITIGVDDLERSLHFYRDGLGLKPEGIIGTEFEYGAVAFFDMEAGLKLAIYPRTSLAHDSLLPLGQPSATEFSLGHNVSSKTEVDAVMEQARSRERSLSNQLKTPFGAATQAISKTPIIIYGRSFGIHSGHFQSEAGDVMFFQHGRLTPLWNGVKIQILEVSDQG